MSIQEGLFARNADRDTDTAPLTLIEAVLSGNLRALLEQLIVLRRDFTGKVGHYS